MQRRHVSLQCCMQRFEKSEGGLRPDGSVRERETQDDLVLPPHKIVARNRAGDPALELGDPLWSEAEQLAAAQTGSLFDRAADQPLLFESRALPYELDFDWCHH